VICHFGARGDRAEKTFAYDPRLIFLKLFQNIKFSTFLPLDQLLAVN